MIGETGDGRDGMHAISEGNVVGSENAKGDGKRRRAGDTGYGVRAARQMS